MKIFLFYIVIFNLFVSNANGNNTAFQFVHDVYSRYSSYNDNSLSYNAVNDSIYSPRLKKLIILDQKLAGGEIGYIDADLLCNCQDPEGLEIINIDIIENQCETTAKIELEISKTKLIIRLKLIIINNKWLIDDIIYENFPSLFNFLYNNLIDDILINLQNNK